MNPKETIKKLVLALSLIAGLSKTSFSQAISGTKEIGVDYTSLKMAIDTLNTYGISGNVSIYVPVGYTETAPTGGLSLGSTTLNASLSATSTLTILKNGVGVNPVIMAQTGGTGNPAQNSQDVIFKLAGTDYVTIDGIDLSENPLNTGTAMMDVGYGLFKLSTSDGCKNNTIQNCTITLNRLNIVTSPQVDGSAGILMANATSTAMGGNPIITVAGGTNSDNKFYSNTIQNCNTGIVLIGFAASSPYTFADQNNDVGGSSALTGNMIINFGGATTTSVGAVGIRTLAQYNLNVSYNTINNNNGSGLNHSGPLRAIYTNTAVGASETVSYNTIALYSSGTTAIQRGIENSAGHTPNVSSLNGNTISLNNNTITQTYLTRTTGIAFAIYNNQNINPANLDINANTISLFVSGNGEIDGIYNQGKPMVSVNMNNNNFDSLYVSTSPSFTGNIYMLRTDDNNGSGASATLNANENMFKGLNIAGASGSTGTIYFIAIKQRYISSNVNNNNFNNLTVNGGTNIFLASDEAVTPVTNFNNNYITTSFTKLLSGGVLNLYSNILAQNTSGTMTASGNNFSNINLAGGTLNGLYAKTTATQTLSIINNIVSNVTITTGNLYGILVSGGNTGSMLSGNSVYNLNSAGPINAIWLGMPAGLASPSISCFNNTVYAVNSSGASTVRAIGSEMGTIRNIYQNKIYDITGNNAGAVVSGIYITGSATIVNIYNNAISNIKGPIASGTNQLFGINITSGTNVNVYNNTVHLNATSSATNFGSTAIYAATISTLTLKNNIFINKSVANGTGSSVAFRRSTNSLTSYANASNKNIFYAGSNPSSYIFSDGINNDATLTAYQTRVGPVRDALSYSESTLFIDSMGTNPTYLLMPDTTITTYVEAGADTVSVVSVDVNGTPRANNINYTGTSGLPDIGAVEGNYIGMGLNMIVDSNNVDQFTPTIMAGFTNQVMLRVRVYCSNPLNALPLTSFQFNTGSSANPTINLSNARMYTTGSGSTFSTTTSYGSPVASPAGTFTFNGSYQLKSGVNYFWLTYDIASGAIVGDPIDAALDMIVVNGSSYFPVNGDPVGSSLIKGPLSGGFLVGTGQTFPNYPTITAAANDLNLMGVNGPVTFTLTDALYNTASGETFPIVFNAINGSSPLNTITIMPNSGVTSVISQSTANALIRLNGTKYLTLEGRELGTGTPHHLILQNDNTSATACALSLLNDATGNNVSYAVLKGSSTNSSTGVINVGAGLVTGNDSNTFDNCQIGDGTTLPSALLVAIGSTDLTSKFNDNNIVSNCSFFNWFSASGESMALKVTKGNTAWTITGNHFYQTAPRTGSGYTGENTHHVVRMDKRNAGADDAIAAASLNNMVFTNNYIGGSAPFASGAPYTLNTAQNVHITSIYLYLGKQSMSRISNNTFANMTCKFTNNTSDISWVPFYYTGGMANVDSNTIGSTTGGNSIVMNSIGTKTVETRPLAVVLYDNPSGTYSCSGNKIGGITTTGLSSAIKALSIGSGTATTILNVANNIIGNDSMDNIVALAPSTSATPQSVHGISNSALARVNMTGNIIRNLRNNAVGNVTNASNLIGIYNSVGAGVDSIYGNLIYHLTDSAGVEGNANASASLIGIHFNATSSGNTLSKNTIYGLSQINVGTGAITVNGIHVMGTTGIAINQNAVNGLTTASTGILSSINGINIASGTGTVTNNMIALGQDTLGTSMNASPTIKGILKQAGNLSAYHNSVLITGSSPLPDGPRTYAFQQAAAGTDMIQNNIFINERMNALSPGSGHIAVNLLSSAGVNSNIYNMNVGDTLGIFNSNPYLDLPTWQAALLPDSNSQKSTVAFVSFADLHLASSAYGNMLFKGISQPTILTDYDGEARVTLTPYIGADEITSAPLPVSLISFTGHTKSGDVFLYWNTASELNNKGFEVQVSTDNAHFEPVGFVKGSGNSNTTNSYRFVHEKAFGLLKATQLYYRLKQVDNDGRFTYSTSVVVVDQTTLQALHISPNPFRDNITIHVSALAENATAAIQVMDLQGRVLEVRQLNIQKGEQSIDLSFDQLVSGVYLIQVELNGKREVLKMIKTE